RLKFTDDSQSGRSRSRLLGGIQAGANWQAGTIVYGWEADVSSAKLTARGASTAVRTDVLASIRGRLGLAFDRILVYAPGGVGMANGHAFCSAACVGGKPHFNDFAWVGGGGVEYALNRNWSIRGEALYYGFHTRHAVSGSVANEFVRLNNLWTARGGINYRF